MRKDLSIATDIMCALTRVIQCLRSPTLRRTPSSVFQVCHKLPLSLSKFDGIKRMPQKYLLTRTKKHIGSFTF